VAGRAGEWLGIVAVLSTLVFAVYVQTLIAVRARKPTEGAGKALLAASWWKWVPEPCARSDVR
jgi:hypothetical protein